MNQIKETPVIEIVPGEVHLQNKIVSETHCYICNKEFNKFDDKEMLLLRVKDHDMGFCCPHHRGVVQEFIKQYKMPPGGWDLYVKKNDSDAVDVSDVGTSNSTSSK